MVACPDEAADQNGRYSGVDLYASESPKRLVPPLLPMKEAAGIGAFRLPKLAKMAEICGEPFFI